MVVVTRRLRTVLTPYEKTKYADFPEDHVLDTSYGVVGRPIERDEAQQQLFKETNPDPSITYFKPLSAPSNKIEVSTSASKVRTKALLVTFTWIFGLVAGILLGIIVYLLATSIPYYSSTISPVPQNGMMATNESRSPSAFATLPNLTRELNTSDLNLNPYFTFSVYATYNK
jgi:hypothetical protein